MTLFSIELNYVEYEVALTKNYWAIGLLWICFHKVEKDIIATGNVAIALRRKRKGLCDSVWEAIMSRDICLRKMQTQRKEIKVCTEHSTGIKELVVHGD